MVHRSRHAVQTILLTAVFMATQVSPAFAVEKDRITKVVNRYSRITDQVFRGQLEQDKNETKIQEIHAELQQFESHLNQLSDEEFNDLEHVVSDLWRGVKRPYEYRNLDYSKFESEMMKKYCQDRARNEGSFPGERSWKRTIKKVGIISGVCAGTVLVGAAIAYPIVCKWLNPVCDEGFEPASQPYCEKETMNGIRYYLTRVVTRGCYFINNVYICNHDYVCDNGDKMVSPGEKYCIASWAIRGVASWVRLLASDVCVKMGIGTGVSIAGAGGLPPFIAWLIYKGEKAKHQSDAKKSYAEDLNHFGEKLKIHYFNDIINYINVTKDQESDMEVPI